MGGNKLKVECQKGRDQQIKSGVKENSPISI
jgi:hypothetical protein